MRSFIRGGLLLGLAVLVAGCDSDDPLQLTDQNLQLIVDSTGTLAPVFNVWQVFEDNDQDGTPDATYDLTGDGQSDSFIWCEESLTSSSSGFSSAPIPFSLQISVIRAGTFAEEILTSGAAFGGTGNLANYDTNSQVGPGRFDEIVTHGRGECSGDPAVVCNPAVSGPTDLCELLTRGNCDTVLTCSGDPDVRCTTDDTCGDLGLGTCDPGTSQCTTVPSSCRDNPGFACDPANVGLPFCPSGACSPITFTCSSFPTISCDPCVGTTFDFGPCLGAPQACEPSCPDLGLGVCQQESVVRRFRFRDHENLAVTSGQVVGPANRVVMAAGTNILNAVAPTLAPLGVCPGFDLGDATIDGQLQPIAASLNKGDTVIVRLGRSDSLPGFFNFLGTPQLRATLAADGEVVDVEGSQITSDSAANTQFSFTVR